MNQNWNVFMGWAMEHHWLQVRQDGSKYVYLTPAGSLVYMEKANDEVAFISVTSI